MTSLFSSTGRSSFDLNSEEQLNFDFWNSLKLNISSKNETTCLNEHCVVIQRFHECLRNEKNQDKIASCFLILLSEQACREVLTNLFPISAKLLETLTTDCLTTFKKMQTAIQGSLNNLQRKLLLGSILSGLDTSIVNLLLGIYKLENLMSKVSSVDHILKQLIKETAQYISLIKMQTECISDNLIIYLFSLLWYAIQIQLHDDDIDTIAKFIRKVFIRDSNLLSVLGRVLSLDILERIHSNSKHVELYSVIYEKIIQSKKTFVLRDVKSFLCTVPGDTVADENDDVFILQNNISEGSSRFSPISFDEVMQKKFILRDGSDGQSTSDEDSGLHQRKSNHWSRRISEIQRNEEIKREKDITVTIEIPERFVGRVKGYEDAILRKIEIESNAVIKLGRAEDEKPTQRPDTSNMAAHRLITGALDLRTPNPNQEKENEKLSAARIKRQKQAPVEHIRRVTIIGDQDEIDQAKNLINDIITCIETITFTLDISVDEMLEHSCKLKTIETLLNVYLEIEEQDDCTTIIVSVCGDVKSCLDAKRLIYEEVGSLRNQKGSLLIVSPEMMEVCENFEGLCSLVRAVRRRTYAHIICIKQPKGQGIFITGSEYEIKKTFNIFDTTNIELLCSLSAKLSNGEHPQFTLADLIEFIETKYSRYTAFGLVTPTLMKKYQYTEPHMLQKRLVYSRKELLSIASTRSEGFPQLLEKAAATSCDCILESPFDLSSTLPQNIPDAY